MDFVKREEEMVEVVVEDVLEKKKRARDRRKRGEVGLMGFWYGSNSNPSPFWFLPLPLVLKFSLNFNILKYFIS